MLGDVVEAKPALAFGGAAAAEGDQPRQAAVGSAIGGPKHDRRGVVGRDFGAHDQFQALVLGGPVRPNHAGQAVAIGDRQRPIPQFGRAADELVGMRRPFEEREVRFAVELGVHGEK